MCLLDHVFYSDAYGAEYELTLSAWGEGLLCEEELLDIQKPDAILRKFRKRYRRLPKSISFEIGDPFAAGYDYGFTGVDPALIEKLETLKELILPDSIEHFEPTDKLMALMKANCTLIRGNFGSFAERFAADSGLRFRPSDLTIAEYRFEPACEDTVLKLAFARSGSVRIDEIVTSPGTSAGNTLGGTFSHPLCADFFKTQTAGEIANMFSERLRDAIISDGRLAAFMETALKRGYYTGKN